MDFLATALNGATAEIELSGLPPISVSLDPSGETNPIVKGLRPAVSIKRNGETVYRIAPYGEPRDGFPLALVAVSVVVLSLVFLVFRALR